MSNPNVAVIVDLQFGSTGKGLMAAWLGMNGDFDAAVTNWGPNAGHTAIYPDGAKFVRTMLANSVQRGSVRRVFIGPGSVIDIAALHREILECIANRDVKDFEVFVHEHAAVVQDHHRAAETIHNRIGSTQKGTGAAVIDKMMRDPNSRPVAKYRAEELEWHSCGSRIVRVVSHQDYLRKMDECRNILVEGCQGYSLGINSGFWPYVTTRECTVAQTLADTCIPPNWVVEVYGCARTFPIRVANRFDAEGNMVGTSGPCYEDQRELDWAKDLKMEPELTTVTKLPRRIFTFSHQQVNEAIRANGVTHMFLNFCNYLDEVHGEGQDAVSSMVGRIEHDNGGIVRFLGYGPTTDDIEEQYTRVFRS